MSRKNKLTTRPRFREGIKALSVTGKILLAIVEYCCDMEYIVRHGTVGGTMSADQIRNYLKWKNNLSRQKQVSFSRLKRRGYIVEQRTGAQVFYMLTTDGAVAGLELIMQSKGRRLPINHSCLVTFDFPEVAKRARQAFRHSLKKIGFKYDQLSVWYCKRDIAREMVRYIQLLKLEKWVHVFTAERFY